MLSVSTVRTTAIRPVVIQNSSNSQPKGGNVDFAPVQSNGQTQVVSAQNNSIMAQVTTFFSSVVNGITDFLKKLFSGQPSNDPSSTKPPSDVVSVTPPAAPLDIQTQPPSGVVSSPSPSQNTPVGNTGAGLPQALFDQLNIANNPQNASYLQNKMAELSKSDESIGPDVGSSEQVGHLQDFLNQIGGYSLNRSSSFDAATEKALLDYKSKKGLSEAVVKKDGSPLILPYVDQKTLDKMFEDYSLAN
jgi:hypothetical protein